MTACRDAPTLADPDLAPGLAERALDALVRLQRDMHSRGLAVLDLDPRTMMALERAIMGEPVARGEVLDALDAAHQAAVRMTAALIAAPALR